MAMNICSIRIRLFQLLHFAQLLKFPHAALLVFIGCFSLCQTGVVPTAAGLERLFKQALLSLR